MEKSIEGGHDWRQETKTKSTIVCSQRSTSSWTSMILNDEVSSNSVVKRETKHFTVLINVPKEKQKMKNHLNTRHLLSGVAFCLCLVAVHKRIYGLRQTQNATSNGNGILSLGGNASRYILLISLLEKVLNSFGIFADFLLQKHIR